MLYIQAKGCRPKSVSPIFAGPVVTGANVCYTKMSETAEVIHNSAVKPIAFLSDKPNVVTGCNDEKIKQCYTSDVGKIKMAIHADDSVIIVAISNDGEQIVSDSLNCILMA